MSEDAVGHLARWLQTHRPAYLAQLNPGASTAELARLHEKLGRELPTALLDLLRWRNGQSEEHDAAGPWFISGSRLLPAQSIAAVAADMDSMLAAGEWDDKVDWWHAGWIPVLDDGNSNYLCVDLVGAFTGRVGQVVEFVHDDDSREIVAPDFDSWLRVLVGSLEAGLWREDDGDLVARSDRALASFWRERLPGYPIVKAATVNVHKKKARVSARDAIAQCMDPLVGPTSALARPVALDKVLKAARHWVKEAMDTLAARGEGSKVEGIYEILPAPGEKRVAYAVWGSRTLANFRDGMVLGFDLKGESIYKKKAVA